MGRKTLTDVEAFVWCTGERTVNTMRSESWTISPVRAHLLMSFNFVSDLPKPASHEWSALSSREHEMSQPRFCGTNYPNLVPWGTRPFIRQHLTQYLKLASEAYAVSLIMSDFLFRKITNCNQFWDGGFYCFKDFPMAKHLKYFFCCHGDRELQSYRKESCFKITFLNGWIGSSNYMQFFFFPSGREKVFFFFSFSFSI